MAEELEIDCSKRLLVKYASYVRDGPLFFYRGGGSYFGKINSLHAKNQRKKLSAEKFLSKKIVHTTLVKLESLFYCNLLYAIICGVW